MQKGVAFINFRPYLGKEAAGCGIVSADADEPSMVVDLPEGETTVLLAGAQIVLEGGL